VDQCILEHASMTVAGHSESASLLVKCEIWQLSSPELRIWAENQLQNRSPKYAVLAKAIPASHGPAEMRDWNSFRLNCVQTRCAKYRLQSLRLHNCM
jgi:hypothetical protein